MLLLTYFIEWSTIIHYTVLPNCNVYIIWPRLRTFCKKFASIYMNMLHLKIKKSLQCRWPHFIFIKGEIHKIHSQNCIYWNFGKANCQINTIESRTTQNTCLTCFKLTVSSHLGIKKPSKLDCTLFSLVFMYSH